MAIDFRAEGNAQTYSGRDADAGWSRALRELHGQGPVGDVVDLGCGGGTYTAAWAELGARSVTGVDSSPPILDAARGAHGGRPRVRFVLADACRTGLPPASADLVFARALVHHLPDLAAFAGEGARLLRPGGLLIVQDRTLQDCLVRGSAQHPRGWFFELVPRLREVEARRRPDAGVLRETLQEAGLEVRDDEELWETRRHYPDRELFLDELSARTGRSVLHELDDDELAGLVAGLRDRLPDGPVVEQDRWTLWSARLPDQGVEQPLELG